jgi:hypothetical protein
VGINAEPDRDALRDDEQAALWTSPTPTPNSQPTSSCARLRRPQRTILPDSPLPQERYAAELSRAAHDYLTGMELAGPEDAPPTAADRRRAPLRMARGSDAPSISLDDPLPLGTRPVSADPVRLLRNASRHDALDQRVDSGSSVGDEVAHLSLLSRVLEPPQEFLPLLAAAHRTIVDPRRLSRTRHRPDRTASGGGSPGCAAPGEPS